MGSALTGRAAPCRAIILAGTFRTKTGAAAPGGDRRPEIEGAGALCRAPALVQVVQRTIHRLDVLLDHRLAELPVGLDDRGLNGCDGLVPGQDAAPGGKE